MNMSLSGLYTPFSKVTLFSTRSVLWTSNMPKMRWWPRLRPGSYSFGVNRVVRNLFRYLNLV